MPTYQFTYHEHVNDKALSGDHFHLLTAARNATESAYAPYSGFRVGAAVMMNNGEVITGFNIENASYPVGICAERAALASAISQFPEEGIRALAISYMPPSGESSKPAFPCGMCRQFISECEDRNQAKIPIILGGQQGKIIVIETAKDLLPFSFGGKDLA
ncbi:MAG: cytidine deaminase [Chitinophagaceae bacterium]|nr:cytidine deaminase [Chitinophagaceae bacterium]